MIPVKAAKRRPGGRPKKIDKRVSVKIYINSSEKDEIDAQVGAAGLGFQEYARRTLMNSVLPRPVPLANFEMWQRTLSVVDELKLIRAALPEDGDAAKKLEPLLEALIVDVARLRQSLLGVAP